MGIMRVRNAGLLISCVFSSALVLMKGQSGAPPTAFQMVRTSDTPTLGAWGDQGDGTYANPIMPGDFSDLDAIRVGQNFYAISSTFQYSPGLAILHSKDLVNWRIIGHVVPDLNLISSDLNWDKMNRNGRGIWVGAIRFHAGKYWVYFGTPDEGLFMSTADDPAGPWTEVKVVYANAGWDDPCPFWDDDGQGYLVTTHFAIERANGKLYNVHLFKVAGDGAGLVPGSDRIIHQSKGSEANKLYKIHGTYYHLYSEVTPEGRVVMMDRSVSLLGAWETKQLIHVRPSFDKEPNQGGLVELASGGWYFVTHQGTGSWEGRAGVLLPVTWIDGWPIIGAIGTDGIGKMLWRGPKPIPGFPATSLVANDDFSAAQLKSEWEWRYQPKADKWSLTERPGYLRLYGFGPLHPSEHFNDVGNVLTQRSMRTRTNQVTIKLDLAGLTAGQEAGIAHFARTFCTFGVVRTSERTVILCNNSGRKLQGPQISQSQLWLRSTWNLGGQSRYSYSLDGMTFNPFGDPYQFSWGDYRGDRIGIFTFNHTGEDGYVDVDSFEYKIEH